MYWSNMEDLYDNAHNCSFERKYKENAKINVLQVIFHDEYEN